VLSQKSLIVVSIESLVGTSLVWLRTKKVRALQGSARTRVLESAGSGGFVRSVF